jgi:hypothetical protein
MSLRQVVGISGRQAMVVKPGEEGPLGQSPVTEQLNLIVEDDGTLKAITDEDLESRKEE